MMKKISYALLSTTLLVSAAVASGTAPSQPAPAKTSASAFSGGYLGVKVGHSSTAMYQQYNNTAGSDVSVPGITGGVFVGWGQEIGTSGLYGGLEVAYLLSSDTYKGTSEIKKGKGLELAFRLGFLPSSNVLLYTKAGMVNSKFEVTPPNALNLKKLSKCMNGMLLGAGIDTALSSHVVVGLDYTYAMYGKQKHQFESNNAGVAATPGTLKPTSHTVMFRAAYRF
jgi:outer membrane immunogenic protein